MRDRLAENPGRVLLTPEDGSAPFYAVLTRADNPTQEGDPLNKNTFWKDTTAALFGFAKDSIPDDGFAFLGKYNQHWWGRRVNLENGGYVAETTTYTTSDTFFISYWSGVTITASEFYEVDFNTGEITLLNPITVVSDAKSGYLSEAQVNSLRGKYCKGFYGAPNKILFLEQDADVEWRPNSDSTEYGIRVNSGFNTELVSVFVSNKTIGKWEYLWSTDRTAYSDSGIENGYEYQYLGIPFDNAVTASKIETGSYTGTGTYGSSDKNRLTFNFAPKVVIVMLNGNALGVNGFVWINGMTSGGLVQYQHDSGYYANLTFAFNETNNRLTWYSTTNTRQMNVSGFVYHYIAIG